MADFHLAESQYCVIVALKHAGQNQHFSNILLATSLTDAPKWHRATIACYNKCTAVRLGRRRDCGKNSSNKTKAVATADDCCKYQRLSGDTWWLRCNRWPLPPNEQLSLWATLSAHLLLLFIYSCLGTCGLSCFSHFYTLFYQRLFYLNLEAITILWTLRRLSAVKSLPWMHECVYLHTWRWSSWDLRQQQPN